MRGRGLWIGILAGSSLQASLLSVITISAAWEEKVHSPFFLGSFNLFCLAIEKLQTFTFNDPKMAGLQGFGSFVLLSVDSIKSWHIFN